MKVTAIFTSMLTLLFATACTRDLGPEPDQVHVRALTQSEKQITNASESFGMDIFARTVQADENVNVFISPLSISMALGMTLNGANGETERAMQNTLGFGNLTADEINKAYLSLIELLTTIDPQVQFEIANSIWTDADFPVEPDFFNMNKTYFDAVVNAINFRDASALDLINGWVKEKTHEKIDKILETIPPEVIMYLINAIYFNGTWTYEFDKAKTREQDFYITENQRVSAPFMPQTNENFSYFGNDLMQAIDLPYGNGQFRMTVLLPNPDKSVADIVAQLNPANWADWMNSFATQKGTLEMPKFKTTYEIKYNDILSAMGMDVAFTEQADFTGINKSGGLFISEVLHKTFVNVYEKGTEAAAVTAVGIGKTSAGGDTGFYMRVERPFLFAIREKSSGTILFIGKINSPV